MARSDLSLFSYEILGLVGEGGLSAHDIRQMVERGRILAWAGESQYYTEPKRLAGLGYLKARTEPGKTRERTVYTLTAKARRALRAYAQTAAGITPLKSDALLRLLICDLVGERATRKGLGALREEIAQLRVQVGAAEESARSLPHRAAYLLMVTDFLSGFLDLHEALVARVESELES